MKIIASSWRLFLVFLTNITASTAIFLTGSTLTHWIAIQFLKDLLFVLGENQLRVLVARDQFGEIVFVNGRCVTFNASLNLLFRRILGWVLHRLWVMRCLCLYLLLIISNWLPFDSSVSLKRTWFVKDVVQVGANNSCRLELFILCHTNAQLFDNICVYVCRFLDFLA